MSCILQDTDVGEALMKYSTVARGCFNGKLVSVLPTERIRSICGKCLIWSDRGNAK